MIVYGHVIARYLNLKLMEYLSVKPSLPKYKCD